MGANYPETKSGRSLTCSSVSPLNLPISISTANRVNIRVIGSSEVRDAVNK